MAPKGVIEKNGKGLKTPLSTHISSKISTLSFLKLFILFQNTYFDFSFFSFLTPEILFLGFRFFFKKPKNLKSLFHP
jgi:hypothetical protein